MELFPIRKIAPKPAALQEHGKFPTQNAFVF